MSTKTPEEIAQERYATEEILRYQDAIIQKARQEGYADCYREHVLSAGLSSKDASLGDAAQSSGPGASGGSSETDLAPLALTPPIATLAGGSHDYNTLFDLICNGGEALAKVVYTGGERDAKLLRKPADHIDMSLRKSIDYGGIFTIPEKDQREQFIASCARLKLEWFSAAHPPQEPTVDEIMEVVGYWMGPGGGVSFWNDDDSNSIEVSLRANLRDRLSALFTQTQNS